MKKTLKTLKKSDNVTITFGAWTDKITGNSYFDAQVRINHSSYEIPYIYGYHDTQQAIDQALGDCGFRVRKSASKKPYNRIYTVVEEKYKRELFKKYFHVNGGLA